MAALITCFGLDVKASSSSRPVPNPPLEKGPGSGLACMMQSDEILGVLRRHTVAMGGVGLAVLGRYLLNPLLGAHLPFSTMYPAMAVAVWYGGWWPTVVATILGYAVLGWVVIPPVHSLRMDHALQWHELATFCAGGFIIILFGELMRRARDRAQRRLEEFETLLETAPVGIAVMTQPTADAVWGNSMMRRMLGIEEASRHLPFLGVEGKPAQWQFRRAGVELHPESLPMLRAYRENRPIKNEELEMVRPGKGELSLVCSAAPLHDGLGQTRGCIAAFLDVTERRRAEQALQETKNELARANRDLEKRVQERTVKLQEALSDLEGFSYSIVHDMRAPLRSMTSFADLLRTGWGDKLDLEAKDYLQRIAKSARRLDALIVDVLSYSQVVREHWPLHPVDLHALVHEIIKSYPEFQAPAAYVSIQGQLPWVQANVGALTQCISNLLDNAIKFAKPGTVPHLTIRAEPMGECVRIWFDDEGIGIPPEWHDRIFALFQQYHAIDKYEGTGIGLTIVRKSVERMGGRVGVQSELGQGSRFWMELRPAATPVGLDQDPVRS